MTKKTKILFIHHGTGVGGAPISLLNLILHLNKDKYDVKVAFIKNSEVINLYTQQGIKTEVIGASDKWFSHTETAKTHWWKFYKYFGAYNHWWRTAKKVAPSYLKTQDFDIVHLNSHVLTSWAYAANKLGRKVVLHNREAIAKGYCGIRRKILQNLIKNNCDAVINISEDNKKRLGLSKNNYVIYNFINIPGEYRPSMGNLNQNRNILYLGGQAKIKGFKAVVECLGYLNPNIKIQFAGNYNKLGNTNGIKEKLKFWLKLTVFRKKYGAILKIMNTQNAELLGLLKEPLTTINACDILITPFKIEHFSRPAVEAFAYGKPVIGSNVEGMNEIVDHGINGLLVEKENPRALANAVNFLCQHPDKARGMGLKGREKAEKIFSPEINTKKVETIYDELMKER